MAFSCALSSIILLLLLLAGCAEERVQPPPQRDARSPFSPVVLGPFVHMSDPNAEAYFVNDISRALESGAWRWTFKRPELKFSLTSTENQRLAIDFAIAEATFRDTGPVTISFFVNGQLLEKARYDQPGQHHFEKPVPAAWLNTDKPTLVVAEADKLWTSRRDGAQLGFILISAGFVR